MTMILSLFGLEVRLKYLQDMGKSRSWCVSKRVYLLFTVTLDHNQRLILLSKKSILHTNVYMGTLVNKVHEIKKSKTL